MLPRATNDATIHSANQYTNSMSSVWVIMAKPAQSSANRKALWQHWLVLIASLIYILSPIDALPDFVPIAGWLDDGAAALLMATEIAQMLRGRREDETDEDTDRLS